MRIGVVGAGVMGSGIAQCAATAGYETVCTDISEAVLDQAKESVVSGRFGFESGVERGKLGRADADAALGRLHFTLAFDEVAQTDLVIECVPERLDLKVRVLRDLDAAAPEQTILASNTSGFSIAGLAAATDRPDRVIGWHWASPPVVMKFAEIITTEATDAKVVATVAEAARACGKNPVVVKDSAMNWGFVANRIYFAMLREADRVVAEGVASHEDVNQLMVDCYRWPVGPFAMVRGAGSGWK